MNNKIVIYTANFGSKDRMFDPKFVDSGVDYIYFTDNDTKLKSNVYKIIKCDIAEFQKGIKDNYTLYTRASKYIKICPHKISELKKYDLSIYHDSDIQIMQSMKPVIQESIDNLWTAVWHNRGGLYEEANASIKYKKDYPNIISRQIIRYKNEGYPQLSKGLYITGVMIRKHNHPRVIMFSDLWWKEICEGSHRCQISFPYVQWITELPICISNLVKYDYLRDQFSNGYFRRNGHLIKSELMRTDNIRCIKSRAM